MTIIEQTIEEVGDLEKTIRDAVEKRTISKKAGEIILSKCIEGLVITQLQSAINAAAQTRPESRPNASIIVPPGTPITN